MDNIQLMTPRQRETWIKVEAYRKERGGKIQEAYNALGLNSATYGNAKRKFIHGDAAQMVNGYVKVISEIASDAEAFSYDDD